MRSCSRRGSPRASHRIRPEVRPAGPDAHAYHGAFITGWLAEKTSSKSVLNALKQLITDSDTRNERRRIVVAVNGELWSQWTGRTPPGGPSGKPLLATSSHFRDTGRRRVAVPEGGLGGGRRRAARRSLPAAGAAARAPGGDPRRDAPGPQDPRSALRGWHHQPERSGLRGGQHPPDRHRDLARELLGAGPEVRGGLDGLLGHERERPAERHRPG